MYKGVPSTPPTCVKGDWSKLGEEVGRDLPIVLEPLGDLGSSSTISSDQPLEPIQNPTPGHAHHLQRSHYLV